MTKQVFRLVECIACVILVTAWSTNSGLAADKLNYSGKYSLQGPKAASAGEPGSTLEVVENEDSLEVTRVELGKTTTSRCPLNGSEGDYTSPGGVAGKCKALFKGKYLVLESVFVTKPESAGSAVRMHTKERWQLSTDSKILTIRTDTDFPDFPSDISAALNASGTLKYSRIENP